MRVVGVDPSIASTGVAFVGDGSQALLTVKSKPETQSLEDRVHRLDAQAERVAMTVDGFDPDLVLVEGPAYGRNNANTHMLAGFWWLLVRELVSLQQPVVVVTTTSLKLYATGAGNCKKARVLQAAREGFPHLRVAGDDESDALALACLGADRFQVPYLGGFAPAGKRAIAGVRWPEMKGQDG